MIKTKLVIRKNKDTGMYVCGNASVFPLKSWEHILTLGKFLKRYIKNDPFQAHLTTGVKIVQLLNKNPKLSINEIDVLGLLTEQLLKFNVPKNKINKLLTDFKRGVIDETKTRSKDDR